ncbi:hypothetical protein D3C71_1683470 [compost metagenome]
MEALGKQTDRKSRRKSIHPFPGVWEYKAIMETASEELKYIIEIITAGRKPGEAIRDEDSSN